MTYYPRYLKSYPNMDTSFPFHISKNSLSQGYPAHRHDFLEFSYVIEGSGWESINGHKHAMAPGTFTFVLPYQIHELFSDGSEPLILYNCMFSMDLLFEPGKAEGLIGLLNDSEQLSPFSHLAARDFEVMLALMDDLFAEYSGNDRWRAALLQAKLKEILIRFDRHRRSHFPPAEESKPLSSSTFIWSVIHYIHSHYRDELTLAGLSKRFAVSMSRISELIKQMTGQNFVHFLHDVRIRHAISLLVSTDLHVNEIAGEVGYGSYKTFSRVFRERKGIVPSEYRKLKSFAP